MRIITREAKELAMWFLTTKDKDLSSYGVIFRWVVLFLIAVISLAFAWRLAFT